MMTNRGTVLLTAMVLSAACSREASTPEDASTEPDAPAACWGTETLDTFFGLARIHDIEITVDEAGMDSLTDDPRSYTHGSVTIDDCTYSNVGVRLKGGAGSFVPIGGTYPEISDDGNGRPGKSAFIVDFNRFVSGVNHAGLEKLTINNAVQDPTFIHEYLGYALFREGGVPTSRTGFAIVTLNGEEKGLYVLVEPTDDDQFLERFYGSDAGNLYEGIYGADFEAPPEPEMEWFDQDNGTDTSMSDLRAVVDDLDAIGPSDDALDVLETHFDMDEYLAFAVTEITLGHWDGYASSANNYKVHHDLSTDTWTFVPWGIDQLFEDDMGRFAGVMQGPGPSWSEHGGRIHHLCMTSARCRARLHQAFEDVLDRMDSMDLAGMAREARDLVEDIALEEADAAAAADHGSRDRTYEAWETVTDRIAGRRASIETWLPCLVGGTVDTDHDTFNACVDDCDDENPDIHPGAAEECNFVDDDCNGIIDDPVTCPRCMGPGSPDGSSTGYYFCFEPTTWPDARQHCIDQGWDLASIHDEPTWEFVTFGMMERFGSWMTWIGLNDRDAEGTFTWTDGSPLDFEPWCEECPRPWGELEDCVVTSPEGWFDMPCEEEPHAFVCQVP